MIIKFNEYQHGTSIELVPESPKEMAQLMRVAKSSKKETPQISFYYSSDTPNLSIWMKKIDEKKQNNYLTNRI